MRRLAAVVLAVLALAGCEPPPKAVKPALWQVEGPHGEKAWLFGTIHALPDPVDYHDAAFDRAWQASDRLVVEIADMNPIAFNRAFEAVSHDTPGPPIDQRIDKALKPELDCLIQVGNLKRGNLDARETWAAALILASLTQPHADARNGVDRKLIAEAGGKPVAELEGSAAQFAVFDGLPEAAQRKLLAAVLTDAYTAEKEGQRLAAAWANGDVAQISATTRSGMLADPALREALYLGRNRDWAGKLATMMAGGAKPFVAVGAAHLAGDDGLPALLQARGYRVLRLQ